MKKQVSQEIENLANNLSGSYWNYRWLKIIVDVPKINKDYEAVEGETEQETYYALHEVYYDKDEKPFMWTEEPVKLYVDNCEDIIDLIGKIFNATSKKVLLVQNDKITELDEYMDKSEILEKYRKGE